MKIENITGYNGWEIHKIETLSLNDEKNRINLYATYSIDGIERCIGVNSWGNITTVDKSNPTGLEGGIGTMEELLDKIDEVGKNLIESIKTEIELKNLLNMEQQHRFFESYGKERLQELTKMKTKDYFGE